MAGRTRRLRPWKPAGLYRDTPPSPAQRQSAATLRDQLITDHLSNDPTAGQSVILDLLTFAKIRHADATSYLATMPRPWIDRRSHRAWQIVHDLGRLERHIAKLLLALVDPSLERRPQPIEDLTSYVARRDAEQAAKDTLPAPADPAPVPESPGADHSSAQEQGAGVGSVQSVQRGSS
jgi:hypothetical protein